MPNLLHVAKMTDIIQRLMDFDKYGLTAEERVKLREEAAAEIFRLREIERRYDDAMSAAEDRRWD